MVDARPAFCDPGSKFKPGAAEAFGRWAAKRVHYPKHDRLHEFLEIRVTDQLGVHAAARRDFACRELVISEDPLLKIGDASREARLLLERRFGERAPFLAPALGTDWAEIAEDARLAALSLFFVHPSISRPGNKGMDGHLQAVRQVIGNSKALQTRFADPMDLLRFLHVVDLNIHRDDEVAEHAQFTGIFVFGSKFSHSCAPNCSWSFSKEGRLQYHAIRPIAKGDLLTFSYVGNGMNLLTSTLERRRRLSTLWFVCQCARCTGPDHARWMKCPGCGIDRGCLPEYAGAGEGEQEGANNDGSAFGERPSHVTVRDAKTWRCASCGGSFNAARLPLREEAELSQRVPEAMMKGSSGAPGSASQEARVFEQLRHRAASTVGTEHWTHALAGFAWLQRALAQLKTETVITNSEAEFQAVSQEVAKWLEANAADSSEQRISALFASLRLEHNLGGGLAAWGYDPAEPLGAGMDAAPRIAELGWRVSAEGSVEGPEDGEGCNAGRAPQRPRPKSRGPPGLGRWR